MMKTYDELLDVIVRRQVYLQRLAEQQSVEIARRINAHPREVLGIIRDNLDEAMSKGAFTQAQNKILARMQKELESALGVNYATAQEWYVKELDKLIQHELDSGRRIVGSSLTAEDAARLSDPSATALNRITATTPYTGYDINDWFAGTQRSQINRVMGRTRVGIANGETLQGIVTAIRGTRASGYSDGILRGATTNQARTLARTITNGVANSAREEFYKANEDAIAYEVFVATLDGRTSSICQVNDQGRHKVGEGPIPPLHPNCRSTRMPVTKLMEAQGLVGKRPWTRTTGPRNEMEKQFRADAKAAAGESKWKGMTPKERNAAVSRQRKEWTRKNVGNTKATNSYPEWFKKQPAWFQKEVLGTTRYNLYKKGGLSIDKFVDHNGQRYNLDQLKKVESAAFKRAGI